jgi:hypothetical protein
VSRGTDGSQRSFMPVLRVQIFSNVSSQRSVQQAHKSSSSSSSPSFFFSSEVATSFE